MTISEFLKGEGKNIELKRELPKQSERYIKSVIAFANTGGGKIVVGIDDDTKQLVGVAQNNVFEIMDAIANAVSDICVPQIVPNVYFQTVSGKCLVIIEVYPGSNRPYYIKSQGREKGTYVRVAGTTRIADGNKIKELEMQGRNVSFDEIVCIDCKISKKAVNKLCGNIQGYMAKNNPNLTNAVDSVQLENWGVLRRVENQLLPTNAFALLTGHNFSFSKIQCARFKGHDRRVFIDRRELTGPIYEQIEDAYQFVLKHINLGAKIEGVTRKDIYEIPPESIRESIVNAVTHRNYMDSACVQVAVYDDRVEITSPGTLFGDLDIEAIKNGRSKIRNKIIAETFSRMNIIEGWGTGIARIISSCLEYGLVEPELQELSDAFRVTIFRKINPKNQPQKSTPKINPKNQPQKSTPKAELEQQMLRLVKEFENISKEDIAANLGISMYMTKKIIKKLRDENMLLYEGSSKAGKWVVR